MALCAFVRSGLPLLVAAYGDSMMWLGVGTCLLTLAVFTLAMVTNDRNSYAMGDAWAQRAVDEFLQTAGHESRSRSSLTGVDQSRSQ